MKEKGFTLVELLGAITILAVISLLAFPPIIEQIRKSKDNLSGAFKEVVYSATDLYMDSKQNEYPKIEGNTYCIALQKLTDYNFLKEPLTDPKTGNKVPLEKLVEIKVSNGIYTYDMPDTCTEKKNLNLKNYLTRAENIITSGNGLYQMNVNEYRYRGGCNLQGTDSNYTCIETDPIYNYIKLGNYLYRIIEINNQGIKVISASSLESKAFDPDNTNVFDISNSNTNNIGYYLNIQSNPLEEIKYIRTRALSATWNVGISSFDKTKTVATIKAEEKTKSATFQIGIINASDYIQSSLNETCQASPFDSPLECRNNNWLFHKNDNNPWTLNPLGTQLGSGVIIIFSSDGGLAMYLNGGSQLQGGIRPVLVLPSSTLFSSGNGTKDNPYIIS